MKRMIHALAAMGAAALFGCAGAPDETQLTMTDPVQSDYGHVDEPTRQQIVDNYHAEFPNAIDGPEFGTREDQATKRGAIEGEDIGSSEQAYTITHATGWAVISKLGTTPFGPNHCVPYDTTYTSDSDVDIIGTCGGIITGTGAGSDCKTWAACILPFSGVGGFIRRYSWHFDQTNCVQDPQMLAEGLGGLREAMSVLEQGTGWHFPEEFSAPSSAPIQFGCSSGLGTSIVGLMSPSGVLTRIGGTGRTDASIGCGLNNEPIVPYNIDEFYTYKYGHILFDENNAYGDLFGGAPLPGSLRAACPTQWASLARGALDAQRRFFHALGIHEMLHFLGFTHEYYNSDSLVNPIWPSISCSVLTGAPLQTLPQLVRDALLRFDTHNAEGGILHVTSGDLSCYRPYDDGSLLRANKSGAAENIVGGDNSGGIMMWTDNTIFGAQTGASHKPCQWFGTGQSCAIAGQHILPYCFDISIQSAEFMNMVRTNFTEREGYTFTEYPSCSTPGVKIKFQAGTCGGNTSNIDGIVCASIPPSTPKRVLQLTNESGYGVPSGTYYSWTSDGGMMTITVDYPDLFTFSQANAPFDDRSQVEVRGLLTAAYVGFGMGMITSRNDVAMSRATLPIVKSGALSTPGQNCMIHSVNLTGAPVFDVTTPGLGYCGAD